MSTIQCKPKNRVVEVYDTPKEVGEHLAQNVAGLSETFILAKGSFTVVLSGGYLIDQLWKLLEPPYIDSINWSKWYIFWVDERCCGWDDEDSNYKLAYDGFLSKVPIPARNIFAIDNKLGTEGEVKKAAEDYEERLKELVDNGVIEKSANGFSKFDLELLGMGPDGHMASLFPGHPQIEEKKKWVTYITDSPKPPPKRITFTLPVINASSFNIFVMVGDGEAEAVGKVLGTCNSNLPAARASAEVLVKWILDKKAAKYLKGGEN